MKLLFSLNNARSRFVVWAQLLLCLGLASPCFAQTTTWLNTSHWGNSGSWSDGRPNLTLTAKFSTINGAGNLVTVNLNQGNRQAKGLDFSGSDPYLIRDGGHLTLADGTVACFATSNGQPHEIRVPLTHNAAGTWGIASGASLYFNNTLSGNHGFRKIGSGTLMLNASVHPLTGTITATAGTIEVGGVNSLQNATLDLDGGVVAYVPGGTSMINLGGLIGTGLPSIGNHPLTIGTVSPAGDGVGTLTLTKNTTISGTMSCDLSGNSGDVLEISGALNISGANLDLGFSDFSSAPVTIATYTNLIGSFGNSGSLPPGVTVTDTGTSLVVQRSRIYVDASNTAGAQDGTSWGTAFSSLQDALAVASDGIEIWVAAGSYYPDVGAGYTDNDPFAYFRVPGGVSLLGGFAGGETTADQRDFFTNKTVLSGDVSQDDTKDADGVSQSADDLVGLNSHKILLIDYSASAMFAAETRVDGVTFTGGKTIFANAGRLTTRGGALLVETSGAGNKPTIENCRFIGNHAFQGGAICIGTYAWADIISCDIRGNRSESIGGGLFIWRSMVEVKNTNISGNYAGGAGGGVFDYQSGSAATSRFTNCTIAGNFSASDSGGYTNNVPANSTLENSIVWGNGSSGSNANTSLAPGTATTLSNMLVEGVDFSATGSNNFDGTAAGNDPLFLDPLAPSTAPTDAGNYRLGLSSPVIDQGLNAAISGILEDLDGKSRIKASTVDLGPYERDTVLPVLTLLGDTLIEFEAGEFAYIEPGATGTDEGNPLPVTITGGPVDSNTPGTYILTYSITDFYYTVQQSRTVTVNPSLPPVITLNGDATVEFIAGEGTYTEPGATATDSGTSIPVTIGGDAVVDNIPGTYVVTYTASDPVHTTVETRTVIVLPSVPDVYVDAPGDFAVTTDNGSVGLDEGDVVTWLSGPGEAGGLTYGVDAFSSIQLAVDRVAVGGTVHMAPGTYIEGSAVTVTRSMCLLGQGANLTEISGNDSHTVLVIEGSDPDVAIKNLAIAGGSGDIPAREPGGIQHYTDGHLQLCGVSLTGNHARGGAAVRSGGNLTIADSLVADNVATTVAGGVNFFGDHLEIYNTTFSGNRAREGAPIGFIGVSGTIRNCTFTANVNDNTNLFFWESFDTSLYQIGNCIVAGNIGNGSVSDILPAGFDAGGNVVGLNGLTLDQIIDPVLADNGGQTLTHEVVAGSPAIDAGLPANHPKDVLDKDGDLNTTEPIPFDQRGSPFVRVDDSIDAGAFERDLAAPDVSLFGHSEFWLIAGQDSYTEFGAEAYSVQDRESVPVVIGGDTVDTSTPGTYVVTYSATGQNNNTAVAVRTVYVLPLITDIYVDEADDFTITTDNGAAGSLDSGDVVTWHGTSGDVAGLTYGVDASSSVEDAAFRIANDGTVHVAAGSFVTNATVEIFRSMTISGDGADVTEISGGSTHRVFLTVSTDFSYDPVIEGLTISNGRAGDFGGGISHRGGGHLLVRNVHLTGNDAEVGGAISSQSDITVLNSTLSNNSAEDSGGAFVALAGDSLLYNSTFSGNSANTFGGAIFQLEGDFGAIYGCTFALNQSGILGTIHANSPPIDWEVANTIMVGNIVGGVDLDILSSDFTDLGGNLIGLQGLTLAEVIDPVLGDNGGSTPTHSLPFGSPAIGNGDDDLVPTDASDVDGDGDTAEKLPTDQRGMPYARIDGTVDSGAYEFVLGGYYQWIDSYFPGETDPAIIGPAADPSGNGVPNLLSFATDLSPLSSTGQILESTLNDGNLEFSYTVRSNLGAVRLRLELGTDLLEYDTIPEFLSKNNLNSGFSSSALPSVRQTIDGVNVDRVFFTVPNGGLPRVFFRLTAGQ